MVLNGVVNQRLVRKLCPFCKKEVEVPKLYQKFISRPTIYQPQGCEYCLGGYKGRIPVVEILWIDETMRKLIEQGATKEFEKYLYEKGHKTLFDDAMELVELGITSIEEVERVVGGIYES
jgi:type II secretory ATPase GspE/PulE/Tfp pilus assembly ATPase PilB-like protein